MKIKVLKGRHSYRDSSGNNARVEVGDEKDVPNDVGKSLVKQGCAVEAKSAPAKDDGEK